jgi:hypothetical protein
MTVWKAIALAAALSTAVFNSASAQSVDPDGANRGYPAYAEANGANYYNGRLQGAGASALRRRRARPVCNRVRSG